MSNESLNILKRIKTLPFKDPTFVKPVFDLICEDANNLNETDKKFVLVYFKKPILIYMMLMIGIISRYMTIGQTMLVSPTIIY